MRFALLLAATLATAEPQVFAPGEISRGTFDSHPSFAPDGRTLYFIRSTPTFQFWTIVVSKLRAGHWSEAQVAPFSGVFSDADPFITNDGAKLYFISKRPVDGTASREDTDIWVIDKAAAGWGTPRNLGAPVNSSGSEWYPTIAPDGSLYFGSDRPGGHGQTDIYRARAMDGRFADVENLDAVNTGADDYEPYVSPDGNRLYFMSCGRPDSLGGCDIYASVRKDGAWTAPINLGPKINSPRQEYSPSISRDGRKFMWSSCRATNDAPSKAKMDAATLQRRIDGPGNGLGDIYEIDIATIDAIVARH
jgi:Tol biopolymer transport system component